MKTIDLDGHTVNWSIKGDIVKIDRRPRSQLHLKARHLLLEVYPTVQMLEEVSIPVSKGKTLFLDFYIPLHKLAIEVHGEQHYKYVSHYHGSRIGFAKSLSNDLDKDEWCQTNGIQLIVLPYNEDENEWRGKFSK